MISKSRHQILDNGKTIPFIETIQTTEVNNAKVRSCHLALSSLTKTRRKEIGQWLSERLGKPDRDNGQWWTDSNSKSLIIFIRNDSIFVEFALVYAQW